jgi:hypothetical protein
MHAFPEGGGILGLLQNSEVLSNVHPDKFLRGRRIAVGFPGQLH